MSSTNMKLGVLLSGRGSNFLAIADSIDAGRLPGAEIAVVISNRAEAPGLAAARERGLNALIVEANGRKRAEHDAEIIAALNENRVDLVCLAGYMRLLSPEFVRAFPQRILNIHPSLLPAFPGLDAQKQALEYGVQISGCTVHFVDEELDHGVIILQRAVPVLADDDEAGLSARILAEEHLAYSEAITRVLSGNYAIAGRRYEASAELSPKKFCCEKMQNQLTYTCADHSNPSDCPDALVMRSESSGFYGLRIHDGGSSNIEIEFCPWCGTDLRASNGAS